MLLVFVPCIALEAVVKIKRMSTAPNLQPIFVQDYLEGETLARRKHEFVAGTIYAMAGGTTNHNRIATNATGTLHGQLREKTCEAFNSDMKVRVRQKSDTRFYYPDLSVVCEPNQPTDSFQDRPVVIVEVISKSTRRTDEHEKRDAYLSIDSLCVYVLVEPGAAAAVVYRRTDEGFDRETLSGLDAVIALPEIDCELPLADVYAKVTFDLAENDDEDDQ